MKYMTSALVFVFMFVFLLSLSSYGSDATDLINAVESGDIATVRVLLAKGVDANIKRNDGLTALIIGIQKGNLGLVSTLIQHGADPNLKLSSGWDPLAVAFSTPSTAQREIILYLIDHGVNLDPPAGAPSPLMGAISAIKSNADAIAIVRHILAGKYNPNHQDNKGKTALMYASEQGCLDFVKGLLLNRADVNLRDKQGRTALMYVAISHRAGRFSLVDPTDSTQKIRIDYVAVAKELLNHGANVLDTDSKGMTALDHTEKTPTMFVRSGEDIREMRALLQGSPDMKK
jgi:ankyrin repeat protein